MSTVRGQAFFGLVVIILCCGDGKIRGGEGEVLEKIRKSHGGALAAIETFSCGVEIVYEPKPPWGDERGECWRSGGNLRCRSESRLLKDDVIVEGTRVVSIDTAIDAGRRETTATITTLNRPIRCDPWSYGLLTFYGQKVFRVTLDELLSQPHRLHTAKMVSVDGHEFAYVDVSHDRARLEIWFDPEVNYLVRKMKMHTLSSQGKKQRGEHAVSQFVEASPGLYFPEKVITRTYQEEKLKGSMSIAFSNIEINKPLPETIFSLRYPPGILVSDLIQGKMFKTDDMGQPRLPATDSQGRGLHLTSVPGVEKPQNEDSPQVTQEEPRSWTRWLLPLSLFILGMAGALWFFERWRRRVKSA